MFEKALRKVTFGEWSALRALAWLSMHGYRVTAEERQQIVDAETALIPTV